MEYMENGVNKGSQIYFYTPSQTAKALLYYPIATGDFYRNCDYMVERARYDSILAIYVLEGSITLEQDESMYAAVKDELLLADCYKKHRYLSDTGAHTLLMHFDGNNSRLWFEEIKSKKDKK